MDIKVDLSSPDPKDQASPEQLEKLKYINSITFSFEFFKGLGQNFSSLNQYAKFLSEHPLIQTKIIPTDEKLHKAKYETVAVGGTFDYLHLGHQILLIYTALVTSKTLIVGVTGNQMLQKKNNKELTQPIDVRMHNVKQFVKAFRPDLHLRVEKLQDPFGPTISEKEIDAIVVSEETIKGAEAINKIREEKSYKKLIVEVCPVITPSETEKADHIQLKTSSTQIRNYILSKNALSLQDFTAYRLKWLNLLERMNKVLDISDERSKLFGELWWSKVVFAYGQYWRFYHTNEHIANVFADLKTNFADLQHNLSDTDNIILGVSIFFHDIVYRPDLKVNQAQSAQIASQFLEQYGQPSANKAALEQIISRVKQMVRSTEKHNPSNHLQKILSDLDMGILDSGLDQYQRYAFNVEKEYRPLVGHTYPEKRKEFLRTIQKDGFKFEWRKGSNVKSNIQWEIAHWDNQIGKGEF